VHREGGALAERAVHLDGAALQVHERSDDRQSEARAGTAVVASHETIEDPLDILGAHSSPGVAHREPDTAMTRFRADRDAAARVGVLVGVRQQVDEDLANSSGIGQRPRQRGFEVEIDSLLLLGHAGSHERHHLGHDLGQIEEARVHLHPARLQAGHVEQVVHEIHQTIGAEQYHPNELTLSRAETL